MFLEYVAGGSIASMLAKFGKFDDNLARSMKSQILLGLEYLHQKYALSITKGALFIFSGILFIEI